MTELYTAKDGRLLSSIFVEGTGTQTVGYKDSDGTDLGAKYIAGSCGVETGFTYNGTDLGDLFIDESGLAPSVDSAGSYPVEGTLVQGSDDGRLASWWIGTYYPSGNPRMSSQYEDNSGGGLITVAANATGGSGSYTYAWTAHAEGRAMTHTSRWREWDEDYDLSLLFDQGWIHLNRKENMTSWATYGATSSVDHANDNNTSEKYISNHVTLANGSVGKAPYVVSIDGGTCSIYPQRILPVYFDSRTEVDISVSDWTDHVPRHTLPGTFEITCTVTDTVSRRTAAKTWSFNAGAFLDFAVVYTTPPEPDTE